MASIKKECKAFTVQQEIELKRLFTDVLADLAGAKAAIAGVTAQLDADATVTDTDYAANNDMAALALTE